MMENPAGLLRKISETLLSLHFASLMNLELQPHLILHCLRTPAENRGYLAPITTNISMQPKIALSNLSPDGQAQEREYQPT